MPHRPDPRFGGKPISQINLTPLVGVLLAVFAGVLTIGWSHAEAEAVLIDQPGCFLPAPGARPQGPSSVVVSLGADGEVSIEGRWIKRAKLVAELQRETARGRPRNVWVRADADVPYGAVFALYRDVVSAGPGYSVGILNEDLA